MYSFLSFFFKVMRSAVWDATGLRWNDDVATGGQTFGEDIRCVAIFFWYNIMP